MSDDKNAQAPATRKKRAKGNFSIFVESGGDVVEDGNERTAPLWVEVEDKLPSTAACEKYIKDNVEQLKDRNIMIAQVKRVGMLEVKTKVTVSF